MRKYIFLQKGPWNRFFEHHLPAAHYPHYSEVYRGHFISQCRQSQGFTVSLVLPRHSLWIILIATINSTIISKGGHGTCGSPSRVWSGCRSLCVANLVVPCTRVLVSFCCWHKRHGRKHSGENELFHPSGRSHWGKPEQELKRGPEAGNLEALTCLGMVPPTVGWALL